MANGKPGDHPLTDILVHGTATFSDEVDQLVRDLAPSGLWGSPLVSFLLLGAQADVERLRSTRSDLVGV